MNFKKTVLIVQNGFCFFSKSEVFWMAKGRKKTGGLLRIYCS